MWSALFPRNENGIDRGFRVFLGGVLLFLAVSGLTAWGWIGLVPLWTGLVGSCPAYTFFGLSTCPHVRSKRSGMKRRRARLRKLTPSV